MWNRMEFPIQQTREECFRNQNSLLPVFLLQHKYHVHTVCLLPGRQRRDPEFWPFDGQAWWKETAATAWEICYGKSASQLCPSNHQISMWLIIWWGSCNYQASFSFLFWDLLWSFPLATAGQFLREGTKMQHALSVWCMFSFWQIFIKMKLFYFNGSWVVRRR